MLKRELKINVKSLLIWSFILGGIYILIYAIYPTLMNEGTKQSLTQMISSMPDDILSAFNMDIIGIEDAYGWFKTEGYMFLTIVGGLYAAILGSTILLKEESDKTIEFLYSKPITRNNIVSSKIICGIINIFLFTIIIAVINFIAFKASLIEFEVKEFLMISFIPILLYYLLFFVMLFISTFFRKTKKAMTFGIGFVFIEYFLQMIGGMGESAKFLKEISFFEFCSARYIVVTNELNWQYIVIGTGIILIAILATYYRYHKKEFLI